MTSQVAPQSKDTHSDFFDELGQQLHTYLDQESVAQCEKAFCLADKAHRGQMRRSGEPYITHPVAAALTLARMHLDCQTIIATLLHDVIEDTVVTKANIQDAFGEEVAELVDGVSKLTQIKFSSRAEAQAENFRKMVLAMVKDLRVIIVKLADRLHNMQTLGVMPAEKKKRIAIETLEIYAPIANRLGMHQVYVGLEDLGFKALHPLRYRVIAEQVEKLRDQREKAISTALGEIKKSLTHHAVTTTQIFGRHKHLYSIYRKMKQKRMSFSDVMDVIGFRVIVSDPDLCYRALGALHRTYKPVPLRFKDYIAIPKANGYQSLHTTLFGPQGHPLEVQIRSDEMHRVAENGIAAHWVYKTPGDVAITQAQSRARRWVQGLLDMKHGNSLEFIENVKIDLFPDEVYVFTPKGHIMELPKGATAVDFAYMVHSDVGNSCVAARIDRRLAPLSVQLSNGQTVEIITAPGARPNPAWLNFVVTGKARANLRHFLKAQKRAESVALGKRLLSKAMEDINANLSDVPSDTLHVLLRDLNYLTQEDLCHEIGMGNQVPVVIAKKLVDPDAYSDGTIDKLGEALAIKGTEGMVVSYADCCLPIPGDHIVGILLSGSGIAVHRDECLNINRLRNKGMKLLALRWDDNVLGDFKARIVVEALNQRGVMGTLTTAIADAEGNIYDINVEQKDGRCSSIVFTISVRNRVHLARVMRRLRANQVVLKLYRDRVD